MMPFTAAKLGAVQESVIVLEGLLAAWQSRVGSSTCRDASLAQIDLVAKESRSSMRP
jgi:hypothetical protein